MKTGFFNTLINVLDILEVNKKLSIEDNKLISFSDGKIQTPVGDVFLLLNQHKSKLEDQFVDLEALQKFVNNLTDSNSLVRLNHIGFCYKVNSHEAETERLKKLIKSSPFHLYFEPSNDEGKWFFIGNTDNWENTMLELIPVEKTNDKWKEYWLPHVQIDIDTTLTEDEIKQYVSSAFGKTATPFPIAIDKVVYIVRNRLGIIRGVNIMLDIATNARNVKYQRLNLLKRIDK